MIRVVFYGTSLFSLPILEELIKDPTFDVVGVVTQPDRPAGRSGTLTAPPVKIRAEAAQIPVSQYDRVSSEEAYTGLEALHTDVAVVASFGQIIPQRVLDLYPRGVLNVHPSLLPTYRGAVPMNAAIRDGLSETGITIMLMDALMDHGPILAQKKAAILPTDTTETLSERLSHQSATLLTETLHAFLAGTIVPQPQDHEAATFVKLLSRKDGEIDLSRSAQEIERLVRAYTPWPGTTLLYKEMRLKVLKAHVTSESTPTEFVLTCGDGSLLVLDEVQPEGKKPMDGPAFLRGQR